MNLDFSIPHWLMWLVPKHIREDLQRRAEINGKARRSFDSEFFEVDLETTVVSKDQRS